MFYLRYLLIVSCVLLLEGTLATRLPILGVTPDLLLAVVVYAGLFGGGKRGVVIGFLVGLLRGCTDPDWLGLEALLLSAVGFAAASTSPMVNRSSPLVQALLIALLLLAHDLLRALALTSFSPVSALSLWINVSLVAALYTAVVVPLVVALLPWFWRGRTSRELS